jgi:hypothetical protein
MAKALKTQRNSASVKAFIDAVTDEGKREDSRAVLAMMEDITGEKPAMWGKSIVGFGSYHYEYASGQEGDWPLVGFSPRKDSLTLYLMPGFQDYSQLLAKLGKHTKGVSCLYIKSLDDVHLPTLKTLVRQSVKDMKKIVAERQKAAKQEKG